MIYELREYVAAPGAAERLHRRFAYSTLDLFERHGMELVGFWQAKDEPGRIVYLMRFDDEEARHRAWSAFQSDEEWRRVKRESEAEGRLVDEQLSRVLLTPEYWPRR